MISMGALELVSAVGVLNLDGNVTNLILLRTDFSNLLEYELGLLFGFDVAAQSDFRLGNGPDMQVVHVHFWITSLDLLN